MSRLGMKSAIARAIVDKKWRSEFVHDIARAVKDAGYDVNDAEVAMLKCNTIDSFDEKFVTIDTMMEFWRISEERVNAALAKPNTRALPPIHDL